MVAAPVPSGDDAAWGSQRSGALLAMLRLRWFIRRRWYILLTVFAVLVLEQAVFPEVRRPWGLLVVLGALAALNLVWTGVSNSLGRRFAAAPDEDAGVVHTGALFANGQVAADLLLLTLILRYTGGVENPMAIFYLFHMAIATLLLGAEQACLQGIWAILLYAGLVFGELTGWISPHYELLPGYVSRVPWAQAISGMYQHGAYVGTAVVVLACGVFGMLYFGQQIAVRMEDRDRRLHGVLQALQQSQQAVLDIQSRRARFMQTAAHQLKSPMAAIQTMAGLIRDQVVRGDDVRRVAERITQRCREGIISVTELLTLARVQDAAPQRHAESRVDVGEVVQRLCEQRVEQARLKNLEFTWQIPADEDLQACVHRADLADCVDNLLENAVKYTPAPGAVTVCVSRTAGHAAGALPAEAAPGRPAEFVAVSVQDTGVGIEAGDLRGADADSAGGSLFDAFRRGNAALAAGIPGSGLGLAVVRAVVEQAGGQLWVHSRPQQGSRFTVLFPLERPPDDLPQRDTRAIRIFVDDGEPAG